MAAGASKDKLDAARQREEERLAGQDSVMTDKSPEFKKKHLHIP